MSGARSPRKDLTRNAVAQAATPTDEATMPSYKVHDDPIDQIKVGERRPVNPEKVKELAESISKIGLWTPLTIRRVGDDKNLVAGLHRLEAAKCLGWKKVPCVYIKGGTVIARLWEISENLHRAELTVLEEGELIAEWLKLTGTDLSAQNGQKGNSGRPKGGVSDAATNLPGKGTVSAKRHKIQRAVQIAAIDPEARQEIVATGFDDSQTKLLKIAGEEGERLSSRSSSS